MIMCMMSRPDSTESSSSWTAHHHCPTPGQHPARPPTLWSSPPHTPTVGDQVQPSTQENWKIGRWTAGDTETVWFQPPPSLLANVQVIENKIDEHKARLNYLKEPRPTASMLQAPWLSSRPTASILHTPTPTGLTFLDPTAPPLLLQETSVIIPLGLPLPPL